MSTDSQTVMHGGAVFDVGVSVTERGPSHRVCYVWLYYNITGFLCSIVCMSADLYFTRLSSFFRQLISELAERNSTIFGHMVGSKCNLKMHVRNLEYPIPYKSRDQKTTFLGRLRNSTAYIFRTKHDIDNGQGH